MHRIRKLGRVFILSLLAEFIVIPLCVSVATLGVVWATMHPPQLPMDKHALADLGLQPVSFTTEDDITLRGSYLPPQNGAVIILAHGHAGNQMFWIRETYLLADHGYGVLLFDFRGHGASEDALVTIGDHERRDLRAALDFVDAQPDVDRIGAVGFSMGAATLVQVAADDERLRAVIIEASFPDLYSALMHRARYFGPFSQWPALWMFRDVDIDDVRPVDDICRISPRPVLLIYGDQDGVIPPDSAQTMFEAACEPVELWIVHGAHHGDYLGAAPKSYQDRVVRFFDTNLK